MAAGITVWTAPKTKKRSCVDLCYQRVATALMDSEDGQPSKKRALSCADNSLKYYRPISQIRLGLFLRLKSDLIFSGASSVWSYFGPYAILTSAGSYIENTTNAGFSCGGFRAVVILHLQQARQLASTEFQRKDKPPAWFHRELPASPLPPAPGKYPRCKYCWWCLHNKRAHDNLFCVTQDRHIVPTESVDALLSVLCLSENLRKP